VFKKLDSLIPEATADDVFGNHAAKAMRTVLKRGYTGWLQSEVDNPTWNDPDWCRMIVCRAAGVVPDFPEDETVTFRCQHCRDTGFVMLEPVRFLGQPCRVARECNPCTWRLWAKAQWLKKAERDGTTRRGRLSKLVGVFLV